MVSSLKALMLTMLKWRRKRGVTAFLPPPGGPIAEMNWRSTRDTLEVSFRSYLPENNSFSTAEEKSPLPLLSSSYFNNVQSNTGWFIPVSMVDILPKKLHGRLRTKLFQSRHVHVVYKDDTLLSHGGPEYAPSPLV